MTIAEDQLSYLMAIILFTLKENRLKLIFSSKIKRYESITLIKSELRSI